MLKISVVMPIRNAERFVYEAINSLLKQTYRDFELILIDDASQDRSWEIIHKIHDRRIRFVKNETRQGVAKSLNSGLKLSRGEYIARMDADDIAYPNRFEEQFMYLENQPKVALVGSWVEMIDKEGKVIGIKKYPQDWNSLKNSMIRHNPFIHPTVMFRKIILSEIGTYDESLNGAEDYDLFARITHKFEVANIPKVLLMFRQSSSSVSFSKMKHVEYQSLKVKLKAIFYYGYPLWQIVFIIKSLIAFLIPASLKTKIILRHE